MILGIVYMFMYSGLQNDHINIIKTFSAWDSNKTMSPLTAGNFACIVLTTYLRHLLYQVRRQKNLDAVLYPSSSRLRRNYHG